MNDTNEFSKLIVGAIEGLPQAIANIFINLLNLPRLIAEGLEKMIEVLPEAIEPLVEAITIALLDFNFWLRVAVRITAAFIRNIPEIIQAFIDGFRNGVKEVAKSFSDDITKSGTALKKAWDDTGKIFKAIAVGFGDLVNFIKEAINKIGKVLGNAGEKILEAGKKLLNFIVDAGKQFFNGIKNAGTELINSIKEGLQDAFRKIGDAFGGGGGGVGGFVSGAIDKVKEGLKKTNKQARLQIPWDEIKFFADNRFAEGVDTIFMGHFHQEYCYANHESKKLYLLPDWLGTQKVALVEKNPLKISTRPWRELL